ncbi:hypothetical protein [Streptomyces chiangmaiensis]|uniref:Secreted protein n=1 Tax=Streptomyces chiangmaiensis TaxID=766497 RepID=A0ABU7FXB2_9ACTN|nr:hypothetical protein [Streptomyces chiangmaiensis]MED7828785.1 hypothetical protein [Streptomyces chiangmaiensis]
MNARNRVTVLAAGLTAATALIISTIAPSASAAASHQQHTMSTTGVYGIGQYTQSGTGYTLQAYVHDTVADGYCAEVWLDFTTDPHEHHGPLMTYACGKNVDGWGATRHANSPNHRIKSFRMAVCRAHKPWARYPSQNQISRPVGCKEWNNSNAAGWAVLAWKANDAKITSVD